MNQPLVSSFFKCWGQHCARRNGEARQTDRGPREQGKGMRMDSPGTWEVLCFDQPYVALRHGAI